MLDHNVDEMDYVLYGFLAGLLYMSIFKKKNNNKKPDNYTS